MEVLTGILNQLDINITVFYNLAFILVMFFLTKILFFNKLQGVLENRLEKTVKSEGASDEKFAKIKEMETEYNVKMTTAKNAAYQKFSASKNQITKDLDQKIKIKESELEARYEDAKVKQKAEYEQSKETLLKEVESLSDSLVTKILQ